jgi:hypothetical protein
MGTDYSARAVVGYVVTDAKAFFGANLRHREEVSHLEDRYDTRTGTVTHQEKVVELEEGDFVVLGGEEFNVGEDGYLDSEAEEALGAMLDACVTVGGIFGEQFVISIEPNVESEDGVYALADLPFMMSEVRRIGDECSRLGFDPGPPGVHSVLDAC